VLAYLLSMNEANGIESLAAIEMAVEEHGKVKGHPIQFVGMDDGCDEEVAREAALDFLHTPSLLAVIGTTCSPGARVAAPLLSDAGMILISPSNKGNDLTAPATRSPGYFRVSSSDVLQAQTAAEFAAGGLAAARAAILYAEADPYSEPLANAFRQAFVGLGGEVIFTESLEGDAGNLVQRVNEVATLEPDLIYYPLYASVAGQLTVELKSKFTDGVLLMGPDSLWSEAFIDSIGSAAAEGVYVSAPTREFETPGYASFVTRYEAQQGTRPTSVWHAYAYDTALLVLAAFEQAAVVEGDGTLHLGRQALRDALYSIDAIDGLTGTLDCQPDGDCGQPRFSVYQYRGGELVQVY
jgi:branched-chain amino acid transport system substrate-binding protein